jgi:hypothetical protein
MTDAKPAPTPLDSKLKLETTSEPLRSINYYHILLADSFILLLHDLISPTQ